MKVLIPLPFWHHLLDKSPLLNFRADCGSLKAAIVPGGYVELAYEDFRLYVQPSVGDYVQLSVGELES